MSVQQQRSYLKGEELENVFNLTLMIGAIIAAY